MSRIHDFAQQHPRVLAGLWFMVSAMPGLILFLMLIEAGIDRPGGLPLVVAFLLWHLCCAFTAGAILGVRLYDTRRIGGAGGAVVWGAGVVCIAHVVWSTVVLITIAAMMASKGPFHTGFFEGVRAFFLGFMFFGIPSMLGGGVGGWLLHRITGGRVITPGTGSSASVQ